MSQDPRTTHRRGKLIRNNTNDNVDGGRGHGEPYRVLFHSVRVDFVMSDDHAVKVAEMAPANKLLDNPNTIHVNGVPIADQAAVRGLNNNNNMVTGSVVCNE